MSKFTGLSLFANVGIAETYLKELGIDIVLANELLEDRCKFYQHLYPEADVICGDITKEKIRNELQAKSEKLKIDFIIATPPCQGMSLAGKRDPMDERNQLIFYAIDLIERIKPKYVLLENVPQQLKTKIKLHDELMFIPDYIKDKLKECYNFNKQFIISAMDYDVPQMRKRCIILMTRKDQKYIWQNPKPKDKRITLRDVLYDLPSLNPMLREGYEETLKLFPDFEEKKQIAAKISKWHYPPTHAKKHVIAMSHTPSGQTAFDNENFYPKKNNGERVVGHYNTYRRLDWDKPSRTMTQNSGVISSLCCVHPGKVIKNSNIDKDRLYSDPRCFSIYELMIVSSLPKDWNIPEWANEKLIRSVIGEGIPPMLVKNICKELIDNYKP